MRELQRKQRLKRLIFSWPSLLILSLVTALLIKGAAGVMLKERQSAQRVENLEAQAAALEAREAELNESIEELKTEEGTKAFIREKFSVAQEGEYMAIIVDEKARPEEGHKSKVWYKRWWDAIIGQ